MTFEEAVIKALSAPRWLAKYYREATTAAQDHISYCRELVLHLGNPSEPSLEELSKLDETLRRGFLKGG
jgi:hypothetical protein